MNRLTDAFLDGMIEKELFQERKAALLMERREAKETLGTLEEESERIPDRLSEFLELAGSAWLSYKSALPEEKRELLEIVTSNRTVDRKNVELELKMPFRLVAERHQNGTVARFGTGLELRRGSAPKRRTVPPTRIDGKLYAAC